MESKSIESDILHTGITPSNVAATQKVRDIKISPDTRQIIYQVVPFYKGSDCMTSELWIADTDVADSARQLTDGLFNDRAAVFHPDGDSIVFLSDRKRLGKSKDLYQLRLPKLEDGCCPQLLDLGRSVQNYELSPDGQSIAFSSIRPASSQPTSCDARVYGFPKSSLGLWIYRFDSTETLSLEGIDSAGHVESFTWSPDNLELLYRLRRGQGVEHSEQEVVLQRVSITSGSIPVTVGLYPRSPCGSNMWLNSGYIVDLQHYQPRNLLDARALFIHDTSTSFQNEQGPGLKRLYGEVEDAVRIVDMQTRPYSGHEKSGIIAVEVCSDVDTHIDAVYLHRNDESMPDNIPSLAILPLFYTQGDAIWFGAWDAKHAHDSATGKPTIVVAAVLSSGIRNEPPNVWSVRIDENQYTQSARTTPVRCKLSSHLDWLKHAAPIRTEVIHWLTEGGTELSGIVRTSAAWPPSCPLPTVLFIHGKLAPSLQHPSV